MAGMQTFAISLSVSRPNTRQPTAAIIGSLDIMFGEIGR
jgi:hypothetical protein